MFGSTVKSVLVVCADCCPGGPCCGGFVPDSTGEEQLAGDGLEVGPEWVRPMQIVANLKPRPHRFCSSC